ncbi:MAG TPA: ABC transporter substrate-binding protein [Crenalkalicoccus sp.]|nr:ABC transporter substrate-binding protein [Crenalkalicoccus sp.]
MPRLRPPHFAAALTLALSLTAHSAPAQPQPASGSLTVALAAEPTTLDPVRFSAGVDTYGVGQIFEQLLRPDPEGRLVNWLAERWEIAGTPEKPIIDVHIRPGVTFHNGDPLTAADFEFSYNRLRDPAQSRWAHLQAAVERFEVVDDLHFRIHFKEPDATYIAAYLQLWAMPKRYFEQVGPEGFAHAPVGTGPWRLVSWKVKEEMRLQAFDGYWNREHRPGVHELTIKFIPEDLTRVAAFRTGAVDWMDAVPPVMVEEFRKMPGVSTASMVSGNNLYIDMTSEQSGSPFHDVRVRQALAHAVDMDAIIRRVLFGQGQRYAEIGPGGAGYDPALKPLPYDPRRARELLRQAGFPNGFDTPCYNLITPREPNVKEMGEAVFAYLTAVGIRCRVVQLEYGAWINLGRRATPPELDGVLSWMWSQGVPGDPGVPWAGHLHSYQEGTGWGSYSYTRDEEMDRLVEEQRRIMDPEQRAVLLRRIAQIKRDRVLGGWTTYRPLVTFAWRTDKVSFTPWPWPGYYRNFQEIGLRQ